MKKLKIELTDLEICKNKINELLVEYNCRLLSADEYYIRC